MPVPSLGINKQRSGENALPKPIQDVLKMGLRLRKEWLGVR